MLIVLGSFSTITFAEATTTTPVQKEITIIEKTVCFNVSITDVYNETTSKEICVVINFHILNARPSNDTINVEFPVVIDIGNKTITKKVIVPLKVVGEVSKIEVKKIEGGTKETENVIIVAPKEQTTTTPSRTTTPPKTATTKPQAKTTTGAPRPVTVTRTVTRTVTPEQPRTNLIDVATYLLIIVVAVVGVVLWRIMKAKEKKEERREEKREDIEDYIEVLKLLKTKLEEKEKELEKERKTLIKFRIKCPYCGNNVSPTFLDDGRIICPVCKRELGRIREDGSLELFPSSKRGKDGVLRKSRDGSDKKMGEEERRDSKETSGNNEED